MMFNTLVISEATRTEAIERTLHLAASFLAGFQTLLTGFCAILAGWLAFRGARIQAESNLRIFQDKEAAERDFAKRLLEEQSLALLTILWAELRAIEFASQEWQVKFWRNQNELAASGRTRRMSIHVPISREYFDSTKNSHVGLGADLIQKVVFFYYALPVYLKFLNRELDLPVKRDQRISDATLHDSKELQLRAGDLAGKVWRQMNVTRQEPAFPIPMGVPYTDKEAPNAPNSAVLRSDDGRLIT